MKLFIALLVIANVSFAGMKTFTHSTNKIVPNSLENILFILRDGPSYCKNCKYKIKEIVTTKNIEHNSDTLLYMWTHTSSIAGTFKFFSYTEHQYIDDDTLKVTIGYPSSQEAGRLSHAYGLAHKLPFNLMVATYTIKRLNDGKSHVYYDGLYKTDNPLAGLFKKTIQKGIEKGANEYLTKFFVNK